MLEWFKQWFQGSKPAVAVPAGSLDAWIKSKEAESAVEFEAVLAEALPAVKESVSESRAAIEQLRSAELRNPDIPERHKHFMAGNRQEYIKQATRLLDAVKLGDDWAAFFPELDAALAVFAQQSARPFQILQEFFGDETKHIALCIASIERTAGTIRKAHARFEALKALRAAYQAAIAAQESISALQSELARSDAQHKFLEEERSRLITTIATLETGPEWAPVDDHQRQLATLRESVTAAKQDILDRFGRLAAALRKYAHVSVVHRELASAYADEPVEALCADMKMQIMQVLADLRINISSGSLQLADDKKERALATTDSITKQRLEAFVREYGKMRAHERQLTASMRLLPVLARRDSLRKELDSYPARIEAVSNERSRVERALAKAMQESDLRTLAPFVSQVAGEQVTIS
ncbi:hypothetical protein HY642_02665 [Candidatus Woesearchaeota archaeon]|nr:hypothetical protein [Candidatus Woesearchaeota archaeon]